MLGTHEFLRPEHRKPNIPKDYSEYRENRSFLAKLFIKRMDGWCCFLSWVFMFNRCTRVSIGRKLQIRGDTGFIFQCQIGIFYSLYQLLKYSYASGPYNLIGAFVVPGLAFGALMLAPFIDRGPERRPSKRPIATGIMLLAIAGVTYLTWEAVALLMTGRKPKSRGKIVAKAGY